MMVAAQVASKKFNTGGGPFPLWPLDREGDYVTPDEVLDEWERFLKA